MGSKGAAFIKGKRKELEDELSKLKSVIQDKGTTKG